MTEQEYNGWTNRETWATMLHIDNDEGLQLNAYDMAKEQIKNHDEGEEINPYFLGEQIKEYIEEVLDWENVQSNRDAFLMLTDIGSLYRVNWREIAEALLDNVREEVEASA